MKLISPSFAMNESIPSRFTCDGDNISPALQWDDIPSGTKSFVVLVHDPDAVRGDWLHWLVKNIPAHTTAVAENVVPIGAIEVTNDFGKTSWGGPCPPSGTHRYFFEIYALDVNTLSGQNRTEIERAMDGHILGKGELIGIYQRQ